MAVTRVTSRRSSYVLALILAGFTLPGWSVAGDPSDLVGLWKNEMQDPASGNWESLYWINVGSTGSRLTMAGIDCTVVSRKLSIPDAIGNIRFHGDRWLYASRAGGETYHFQLQQVTPAHYEGQFARGGQIQPQRRRMLKITSTEQLRSEMDLLLARLAVARRTAEQLIAMSRQDQQHWAGQAVADRETRVLQPDGTILVTPTGGTGALPSLYQIQATGRLGGYSMDLQQIQRRIEQVTAARQQLGP